MGFDGKLFSLDDDTLVAIRDGLDDILDLTAVDCILVYAGGGAGPPGNPWDRGGESVVQPTRTVRMRVAWEERDFWARLPAGVTAPAGAIQTRGRVSDMDAVIAASYMLVGPPLANGQRARFERAGDPVDPFTVTRGAYFVCNWLRAT